MEGVTKLKCSKCGAEIESGSVFCDKCGEEVRIVPDYNPLEDALTSHVKNEIGNDGGTVKKQNKSTNITEEIKHNYRKKKKILITLGCVAAFSVTAAFSYWNSYAGQLKQGYTDLKNKQYEKAIDHFHTAIKKNPEKEETYLAISDAYLKKKEPEMAEEMLYKGIETIPEGAKLYKALSEHYIKTDRAEIIPVLLSECDEEFLKSELQEYYVPAPEFDEESGEYEEEVELEMDAFGCNIYYTLDDSRPSLKHGEKYEEPVILEDGEWTVRAVAFNEQGIPGLESEEKFKVDIPIPECPVVTPSSNMYEEHMNITVSVPEGCKAYYTFDGSIPDDSSKEYKGPISMPQGNTIFTVVLIDEKGRSGDTTIRNYDLHINPETE